MIFQAQHKRKKQSGHSTNVKDFLFPFQCDFWKTRTPSFLMQVTQIPANMLLQVIIPQTTTETQSTNPSTTNTTVRCFALRCLCARHQFRGPEHTSEGSQTCECTPCKTKAVAAPEHKQQHNPNVHPGQKLNLSAEACVHSQQTKLRLTHGW